MNSKTKRTKKARQNDDARVLIGSGNVFRDLGRADADEALAKVELAYKVHRLIEQLGISQTAAAALLGTDRARVSNLMRGRLAEFSIERLFYFLNKLGQDVEVTVRPKRQAVARVHVMAKAG
jgi:predicted XRE-type DNA-binding protein